MFLRRTWVFLFFLFSSGLATARPLGLRPEADPEGLTLVAGVRSDLWLSPYSNKTYPLRLYDVRFASPFLSGERWTTSLKAEIEGLSSGRADLLAGRRRVSIGPDLRGQAYGLNFSRRGDTGNSFAVSMSYVSASDEPYRHDRDKWMDVSTIYRTTPVGEYQWLFGAQYSKNRGFYNDMVLPVIGVVYRPRPGFSATFGLPFISLNWEDPDGWSTVFTTTVTSVVIDSTRHLNDIQDLLFRAGFASRAYLHENRIEDDMRLFFEEKYVDVGLKTELSDKTSMYTTVGRSFERNFYEGKSIYDAQGPKTNLDADFYGRLYFVVEL